MLARLRHLHLFGSPYLPIPATPVPLPTHYHIRYGSALQFAARYAPSDADDPDVVASAAEDARHALAQLMHDTLAARRGVFR